MTPKPDSETFSKKPLISASLHPSNNAKILPDKAEILLDDNSIKDKCKVSETDIFCTLTEDISVARHKVKVTIEDTKGKKMTEEWYFTIRELSQPENGQTAQNPDTVTIPGINKVISKSGLIASAVLCCVALLLIIIPWLIYSIWSKRADKRDDNNLSSFYQPGQVQVMQPQQIEPTVSTSGFYTPPAYPEISSPPEISSVSVPSTEPTQNPPTSSESSQYGQPTQDQRSQPVDPYS
jgi:hypothetical protein